ncbi:hypothetical protein OC844_001459 [Tilletia horrida]|nr:hypothetical protein OC844_001459 [Tilletia horrida]
MSSNNQFDALRGLPDTDADLIGHQIEAIKKEPRKHGAKGLIKEHNELGHTASKRRLSQVSSRPADQPSPPVPAEPDLSRKHKRQRQRSQSSNTPVSASGPNPADLGQRLDEVKDVRAEKDKKRNSAAAVAAAGSTSSTATVMVEALPPAVPPKKKVQGDVRQAKKGPAKEHRVRGNEGERQKQSAAGSPENDKPSQGVQKQKQKQEPERPLGASPGGRPTPPQGGRPPGSPLTGVPSAFPPSLTQMTLVQPPNFQSIMSPVLAPASNPWLHSDHARRQASVQRTESWAQQHPAAVRNAPVASDAATTASAYRSVPASPTLSSPTIKSHDFAGPCPPPDSSYLGAVDSVLIVGPPEETINVDESNPKNDFGEMRFYHRGQAGYYLTNFYRSPFMRDGQMYGTSEAYFQSRKFLDKPLVAKQVASAPNARTALDLARKYRHDTRPDWTHVSVGEMFDACMLKFMSNSHLRAQLLATDDAHLVEAAPDDYFWGEGRARTGRNELGHVLVAVRTALLQLEHARARAVQASEARTDAGKGDVSAQARPRRGEANNADGGGGGAAPRPLSSGTNASLASAISRMALQAKRIATRLRRAVLLGTQRKAKL